MSKIFRGNCACGSVSYEISSLPLLSAYCHCTKCQRLAGGPCVYTLHFPAPALTWTNKLPEDELLNSFIPPGQPHKALYTCKSCGVLVALKCDVTNKYCVRGAHFERDEKGALVHWEDLKPTTHIYYDTRLADVNDGLSKWAGFVNESERLA